MIDSITLIMFHVSKKSFSGDTCTRYLVTYDFLQPCTSNPQIRCNFPKSNCRYGSLSDSLGLHPLLSPILTSPMFTLAFNLDEALIPLSFNTGDFAEPTKGLPQARKKCNLVVSRYSAKYSFKIMIITCNITTLTGTSSKQMRFWDFSKTFTGLYARPLWEISNKPVN